MARETPRTNFVLGRGDVSAVARVEEVFRIAARRIRTRLVNRGGADVQVRFGTAEVGPLGGFMDRFRAKEGAIYARLRLGPGDMPGLLVVEAALLQHMIGLMLGDPTASIGPQGFRAPTAIDLRIARRIMGDALIGVTEMAAAQVNARARIEGISANPAMVVPFSRGAVVLETSLDFGPPGSPFGLMSFLFPAELVHAWFPTRPSRTEGEQVLREGMSRVMPIPETLVAELTRVKLTLADLKGLKPGSVIDLGPTREVPLRVGGRVAFVGEPGEQNGVRSVRVKNRLESSPKLKIANSP